MSDPSSSIFHFHACAHAFSGLFTRPFHEQIHAQAQASLPITGGHGNSRVEDFKFHEFISFKKAYSHVSGGFQADDRSNNALVTSTLEGLNMLDILTADRIVSRLYSKHPEKKAEGNITMHGSTFDNLRICGVPVGIELDFQLFESIQTFEKAREEFGKKSAFWKIAKDPLQSGQAGKQQGPDGTFLCSLVKKIEVDYPGVTPCGHGLHVPGFGRVYFAEVFLSHGQRTLTMLRYELGSSISGSGSALSTTANGRQYPPTG
jgi:hypothetical protein